MSDVDPPAPQPPGSAPGTDHPATDAVRWDEVLLAAGFEVDPDDRLSGPAAAELATDSDGADVLDDPWRHVVSDVSGLTDEQRAYVDATSPAFGAALPSQTLTGDDPFGDVSDRSMQRVDDEIIDFD